MEDDPILTLKAKYGATLHAAACSFADYYDAGMILNPRQTRPAPSCRKAQFRAIPEEKMKDR